MISIRQSGSLNTALIEQTGNGNLADITQIGERLGVRLWQQGNNQTARIIQTD